MAAALGVLLSVAGKPPRCLHILTLPIVPIVFFQVSSYGVGRMVKLPGATIDSPNRYAFGSTTYADIYNDLKAKDEKFYQANGLLAMMQKDMKVKEAPQRFQDRPADGAPFDVLVTFESRVMDIVVDDLRSKEGDGAHPCLVINMDVKDSAAEAATAALHALRLCQLLEEADDWEAEVDGILDRFADETGRRKPQYDVCFQ